MIAVPLIADELVGALDSLGVHFLTGGVASPRARSLAPADLLAQLAAQTDAHVQLAVILMACLKQLGERHAVLTGLNLNWIGTFDHAAQRLIKRLEHEAHCCASIPASKST